MTTTAPTSSTTTTAAPSTTTTTTAAPTTTTTTAPSVPGFGDGTHTVGQAMQPGLYRAANPSSCYWARPSGFSGDFDELIANNNTNAPEIVEIEPTDVGFESTRCGDWTMVG